MAEYAASVAEPRPPVPEQVKRRLRQEAGFGCCRCGSPIIQYQHIIGYAKDPHFRAEDMMVLCPGCHDMATKGALPEPEQRKLKARPFNIEQGLTYGQLTVTQGPLALTLGSILVINDGPILAIGDVTVLSVIQEDGAALLSIDLRDEAGTQLLLVVDNEWILGPPEVWDMQADYQRLTLHAKARDIRLSLNLKTTPGRLRGRFWHAGQFVEVAADGIRTESGLMMSDLAFVRLPATFVANGSWSLGAAGISGYIISEADPMNRYAKAVNAYRGHPGNVVEPIA